MSLMCSPCPPDHVLCSSSIEKVLPACTSVCAVHYTCSLMNKLISKYKLLEVKDKDQLWSCDFIVKETLWNRSEKVDHLAYKYWCVLQGSRIIKMIRNLTQSS